MNQQINLAKLNCDAQVFESKIHIFQTKSFILVMSQEWIMFLHGLNTTSPPSEKSKKFYITSNASQSTSPNLGAGSGGAGTNAMKSGTSKSAFAKMRSWAGDIRGRFVEHICKFCNVFVNFGSCRVL